MYDQIMAQCLNSNRALNLLSGKHLHQFEYARLSLTAGATFYICVLSVSTPDMTLDIKHLLAMIPATEQDIEYEQVRL